MSHAISIENNNNLFVFFYRTFIMSFLGNFGKKAVEKAYNLASKVEGGRDYLTTAANTVNSLVKGKDPR